jgi:hypothetical protein
MGPPLPSFESSSVEILSFALFSSARQEILSCGSKAVKSSYWTIEQQGGVFGPDLLYCYRLLGRMGNSLAHAVSERYPMYKHASLFALCLAFLITCESAKSEDWPTFMHDSHRSG